MEYLFVYGTLRAEFENPKSKQLLEDAELIGEGYFYGRLYNVSWYPGAIISFNKYEKVFGGVYQLKNVKETFEWLDKYEGFKANDKEHNEYIRKKVTIFMKPNKEIFCWVYLYNKSITGLKHIESGDYLSYIRNKTP